MSTKPTSLTKRIDDILCNRLNIIMDTTQKWTIEEILEEVHLHGVKTGKTQKVEEIRAALDLN